MMERSKVLVQLQQWIQVRQQLLGKRAYGQPSSGEAVSVLRQAAMVSAAKSAGASSSSRPSLVTETEVLLPSVRLPRFRMAVVGGEDLFSAVPEWQQSQSLGELYKHIHTCTKCSLGLTRTHFVFGVGNPNADIVLVGEAPGAEEDARGEPFVGAAGQLLNRMLQAIGFRREDVYICNILKCRPPNNRRPMPQEIETCRPYLWKQLELIQPAFLLALGATAAAALLQRDYKIADLRGRAIPFHGLVMVVTYHPAALLRNPQWKRPAWEDLQLLRRLYDAYRQRLQAVQR
ncbi:MAG: uracil-DNA glycosylase [Candidatus Kapabacteria bacterium]|nr:uracil-DNA glycosylase [Candidatus Kapabacteria bacterium]MCS7170355.1 uracil-DNA glycosylase [Candidatus Kapabacteria bacterium]MDW7997407.1 uracil-DNA glycosylase [Bacteroidota bacterium]MDW8224872.1 uracil-DNA glycosylase [Bacteroidota bacterium]